MALFARLYVLRGFQAAAYRKYSSPKTLVPAPLNACPMKCLPCGMRGLIPLGQCLFQRGEAFLTGAALIQTKIAHLWMETRCDHLINLRFEVDFNFSTKNPTIPL